MNNELTPVSTNGTLAPIEQHNLDAAACHRLDAQDHHHQEPGRDQVRDQERGDQQRGLQGTPVGHHQQQRQQGAPDQPEPHHPASHERLQVIP